MAVFKQKTRTRTYFEATVLLYLMNEQAMNEQVRIIHIVLAFLTPKIWNSSN